MKIYVSNVATQHGETDHYSVQDHVRTIAEHIGGTPFDFVLANSNAAARLPLRWRSEPVQMAEGEELDVTAVIESDIVDTGNRYRHDSNKLAAAILTAYHEHGEAGVQPRRQPRGALAPPLGQ